MRYYNLQIFNTSGVLQNTYTNLVNGQLDPGALQLEFDMFITPGATPAQAASIKLWGVPLQTIGQASNFNGMTIKLQAGFQPGLPLATKAFNNNQTGLLLQGTIQQAFGNWIETNQWLEFVVVALSQPMSASQTVNFDIPTNLTFNCPKGTSFSTALTNVLQVAYPNSTVPSININPALVSTEDVHHISPTFTEFCQFILSESQSIINSPTYGGVQITPVGNQLVIYDGTQAPTITKALDFTDLVGQPTWSAPDEIQVITSLRSDLNPGDSLTIPPTAVTISPSDPLVPASRAAFAGSFYIKQVRHVGNFRQPSALSWITVLDCAAQNYIT